MTKTIIRFRFPGNITWDDGAKSTWAKVLQDYIESELEIGNGTFMGITQYCTGDDINCPLTMADSYTPKEIHLEIIADMPKFRSDDEADIRKKLITLLEDGGISFTKFHSCGNTQNITVILDSSQKHFNKSSIKVL